MEHKKIRRVPLNKKNLRKLKIKKRRKQKLIQRRLGIILAFLVTLGACVWGIALITSKVFCVKEITVEGNTLYEDREIFKPYEKHHSTALDAGKLAQALNVKNLVLYHTEDSNLNERKTRYTSEAKIEFHGKVYVPDDLEVINL